MVAPTENKAIMFYYRKAPYSTMTCGIFTFSLTQVQGP